jgi:tetratricopeptide (TPR) repeat protein
VLQLPHASRAARRAAGSKIPEHSRVSFFKRLFGIKSPAIPQLYPNLKSSQLEQFLSDADYVRVRSFENVYILPMVGHGDDPGHVAFGVGLSRLLIRNLMLLRDVSIHGPEDTPLVTRDAVADLADTRYRSTHVTGEARISEAGFSLSVEVHREGHPVKHGRIESTQFAAFLAECSAGIAKLLGWNVDAGLTDKWRVGQPKSPESLTALGDLHVAFERDQTAERAAAARKILDVDPAFVVAAWDYDSDLPDARQVFLSGLERDPYNAQLCFLTFCQVWHSRGPQPEALQFCRRAIELSPGHGKAHMCAPHAARNPITMLRHSELGYRLLPGNSFAVNNYTINLTNSGTPAARLIELAEEGIADDPNDPGNYERIIDLQLEAKDYRGALATAERLQRLFEPTMNKRALYCLRQNPERARMLAAGKYDPAAENRQRIAALRKRM